MNRWEGFEPSDLYTPTGSCPAGVWRLFPRFYYIIASLLLRMCGSLPLFPPVFPRRAPAGSPRRTFLSQWPAGSQFRSRDTVDFTATQAMTKEVTEKMFAELTKGQDLPDVKITPKAFADAVTSTVAGAGDVDPSGFSDFRSALEQLAAAFTAPPNQSEDESTG